MTKTKAVCFLGAALIALAACTTSTLDRESMRKLDEKGQAMMIEYGKDVEDSNLPTSIKDPKLSRIQSFRDALRQEAINAGNTDLPQLPGLGE